MLSGSDTRIGGGIGVSASCILGWPTDKLRLSASDGGLADPTNAYFGFNNRRSHSSTIADRSAADNHRLLVGGARNNATVTGIDSSDYFFTMDDLVAAANGVHYYASGSRKDGNSVSSKSGQTYKTVIDNGYDRFTAPFFGGFDGLNIKLPDPFYNKGMTDTTSVSELNNSAYYTIKKAFSFWMFRRTKMYRI